MDLLEGRGPRRVSTNTSHYKGSRTGVGGIQPPQRVGAGVERGLRGKRGKSPAVEADSDEGVEVAITGVRTPLRGTPFNAKRKD